MKNVMEKDENQNIATDEKKKKLTPIQIVKIVMAGISAVFLILGIVFTCVKTPIEGSIYRINTSLKEREETWENKRKELFDYYDNLNPASYYENRMQTNRLITLLYKISFSNENADTKQLNLEVLNYTETTIKILWDIKIEHRDSNKVYRISEAKNNSFTVKQSKTYNVIVDKDFNMDDYVIWAVSVDDDNDGTKDWDYWGIKSYEKELERNKVFCISDDIEELIGEMPTSENESTQPIPDYMVKINNAKLRYILYYFGAVIFLLLAIFINESRPVTYTHGDYYSEPNDESAQIIIKEIHHQPAKPKKVDCLYCGSRYSDNLDGCPNCGSNKIKEEPKEDDKQ